MKKFMCSLLAVFLLAGCNCVRYEDGMYNDVTAYDAFSDGVEFSINEGYMEGQGETFGVNDIVSLSDFADILVKISGKRTNNAIEYLVKENIAPMDFPNWDAPLRREDLACMLSNFMDHVYKNSVVEGSIKDAEESYAKDAIYAMYRMGIFDGQEYFCPYDNVTRSEMAVIVQRVVNEECRVAFSMDRLEASFIAFGDVISHFPVVKSGKTNVGYDFTKLFENVKDYIDEADVSCVNQETVFVPDSFSGYPSFGGPEEMGIAEAEAGFDVVTHATNHAFDRGEKGILYTTDFWNNYPEITVLGIHEDENDAEEISVIEVNGIKIALLNYTYSLNGYSLPKGKEYMVDVLDEEEIVTDMARAREVSDAIVVFAHWGNEYQNKPDEAQKNWAQLFADNGADVIVGHHPHVVQPLDFITSVNGENVPVYYSLGNFISNQNDYQTALCAMADFKIVKDLSGVRCEESKIEPVVTHMESGNYSAYLLSDYSEEKAKKHKHRGKYGERFSKENYAEVFNNIMGIS